MMIVTQAYDGTFVITGITFAELEDLISAYDSTEFLFVFPRRDDDLYADQDPMGPIRKAIANAQLAIGET